MSTPRIILDTDGSARLGHRPSPRIPQKLIAATFKLSEETYGYRRVHAQLVRQGERVCPELVRELMCELELVSCQPRPYRPTTTTPGDPGLIPDLVNRDFTAEAPGEKMISDITYIPTGEDRAAIMVLTRKNADLRVRVG